MMQSKTLRHLVFVGRFWNNPQYNFTVSAAKSGSSASHKVVVSVLQRTDRFADNQSIGFYLFQVCLTASRC